MIRPSLKILLSALALAAATTAAHADYTYSNAVVALSPVAYWPLSETIQPPSAYIATNSGTLGARAQGYYNNAYYPDGTGYNLMTLFTGPEPGVTSDGDAGAQFNGGANGNDNSGYVLIPDIQHALDSDQGAFTAEAWVMPEGGDPNDPTGNSYASTEWTGIIKKGGGGAYYTENGDVNGNTYGWTVALAGIYALGAPDGWYGGTPYTGPLQLETNACWVVDFYNGGNGNTPSMEFDVPLIEPTPAWFHLVLVYDGTNANFYVNGALQATTVPGLPQSTNHVFAAGAGGFPTSATGAYQFVTANGVGYAPDTINPMCLGNINESYSIINQGYPQANATGFNCQDFNGVMDEVAYYTNGLSAATVLKHYSDATAANTTLYTNDVLSATPPVYLRLDEPAYVEPPSDYSTYPTATNYGSMGSAGDGLYQPGVIPASPGAVAGGFGTVSEAVQFNGLDAAVDVGNGILFGTALDPQGTVPFSLAYWFRSNPADCYGRFQTIIGRGDNGWRSSLDGSGLLRWNPGNGPEIASSQNYNDGQWHFVVGVSDGSTSYLYVDGQLSASAAGVGGLAGASLDLFIGGAPDYTTSSKNDSQQRYFAGAISEVAFFSTNLTASQVQALYAAGEVAAEISENPQSLTLGLGASGSLTVMASGTGPFTFQWYAGSSPVSNVAGNILGASTATLTITNALTLNAGNYSVVISNSYGSITSAVATVTIALPPTLLSQPTPARSSLYTGNQITFQARAAGAPPLNYQWYKNTTPVSGSTSSNLVLAAASGTNAYDLVVANSYGSITSSIVTIIGEPFVVPSSGFTVNFAVAPSGTAADVYAGQGVYNDPGNNYWNPFSGGSGTPSGLALSSGTNQTYVTSTLYFGFNNGAGGETQGTPAYLLAYEDAVNTNNPGIGTNGPEAELEISDLPQGTYSLYLYGNNYDGTRGSIFTVAAANGGVAANGIDGTVNGSIIGGGAVAAGTATFAEGDNYVLFTNVVADATGTITVTYIPNPAGSLTGEAPFNGFQVVGNFVAQPTLTIQKVGATVVITWTSATAVLQSSTNVAGPYTTVSGAASPYTAAPSGALQFYRLSVP